jgi:hypothetical protein
MCPSAAATAAATAAAAAAAAGPAPAAQAGAGNTPENRQLLEAFYLKHDPGKVGTVDKILSAYKVERLAK